MTVLLTTRHQRIHFSDAGSIMTLTNIANCFAPGVKLPASQRLHVRLLI